MRSTEIADKIRRQMVAAISDYKMIENGDKVLVAVSGGKDSSILLKQFVEIQKRAKINFIIEAVIVDQKQPGFMIDSFLLWVENLGVRLNVLEKDTYSIVTEKIAATSTYCSLCSRLRRGILYNFAAENNFTKLALGHHRDDLNETTLLNLIYSGKIASMPPILKSDDSRNVVIRPLCYVAEKDLIELSEIWNFPVVPCNLCGSQDGLKRKKIKKLIAELSLSHPQIPANILASTKNIRPSQLLDTKLWDFQKFEPNA